MSGEILVTPEEFDRLVTLNDECCRPFGEGFDDARWLHGVREILGDRAPDPYGPPHPIVVLTATPDPGGPR